MSAADTTPTAAAGRNPAVSRRVRRLLLIVAYVVVLLGPVALIASVAKAGAHGWLVILADVLGFAGLSLLALQIVISGRWAAATSSFGLRSVLSLHRKAGVAVVVLVVVHVVALFIDDPSRIALLDPWTAPPRARAGVLAVVGLLLLAGTSVWRARLRLSYERWRAVHLACTGLVIFAAFAHVVWVNAYMSVPVVRWSVLGLVLAAGVGLFWARVAQPYCTARRPCVATSRRISPGGVRSRAGRRQWSRRPRRSSGAWACRRRRSRRKDSRDRVNDVGYAKRNIRELEDVAVRHGLSKTQEARFPRSELGAEQTGIAHLVIKPDEREAFAHRHTQAEEIYVVLGGSGRVKLDDELVDLAPLGIVRVSPPVARSLEAGPDGLEVLVFGSHVDGDGEIVKDFWSD